MTPYVTRGFLTVELLIAMAVFSLTMTGVFLVAAGGQSAGLDVGLSKGGIGATLSSIQKSSGAAAARTGFLALTDDDPPADASGYDEKQTVTALSSCTKSLTRETGWGSEYGRSLSLSLATLAASVDIARELGGDCVALPPPSGWENPQRFASDTLNPGKSTALDALRKIAYLGSDKEPYLAIADARNAVLGQTSGMMIGGSTDSFDNNFNSNGKSLDSITDIDVAFVNGSTYAFVTTASTTAQFAVIDVSDIQNPVLIATRSLNGVTATDSTAWGWRVFYLNNRVYVTARETAGPELHIFDVSTPSNPTELGNKELNTTVNDFTVFDGIAYFADESDARGELLTYDVSNPAAIAEITGAATNLPGDQNGASIALVGNKLYLGRESVSGGPELYVFNATNPKGLTTGYSILGSKEIGADVIDIDVVGRFAFLVTGKTNEEFQVWNISNPANILLIKKYNFGNIVAGGADYETDFVYATGNATPNFQILYGGPPFTYTLSNSGSVTASAGQSRTVSISASLVSGSATTVSFAASGLPAGVTASFSPVSCSVSCASTLTLQTNAATPAGSYSITVTGTPGGQGNAQTTFTLTVTAPFTYTLSNSGNITVAKKATGSVSVLRTLTSGTAQAVTVSAVYTPALPPSGQFTVTVTNATANPGSPCTGTCVAAISIGAKQQTPSGLYTFTVTGTSSGLPDQTTVFTVTVP